MYFLAAFLLCATGTLASKPQPHLPAPAAPRTHNNLALRLRGPANATSRDVGMEMRKRDSYTGVAMTWYPTNTGPDACTGKNHKDSDWFVAMNYNQFGDGSSCCGKQLRIDYNGKSTVATCVDECASCDTWGSLDFTQGLFEFFVGDPGIGEFYGSWSFSDGSDDPTTTTSTQKKTTTTYTSTPTPTTHSTTSTTHTTTSTTHTTTSSTTHSSLSARPSSSAKPSSSARPSSSSVSASASPSASVQAQTTGTQNVASFNDVLFTGGLGGASGRGVVFLSSLGGPASVHVIRLFFSLLRPLGFTPYYYSLFIRILSTS
ncbi:hypothetical protein DFH06DRAFT_1370070 [Mycena polygramma]|nr:hypothetical protein DFH06DRAFT_1370070 [Mycena polygramma]